MVPARLPDRQAGTRPAAKRDRDDVLVKVRGHCADQGSGESGSQLRQTAGLAIAALSNSFVGGVRRDSADAERHPHCIRCLAAYHPGNRGNHMRSERQRDRRSVALEVTIATVSTFAADLLMRLL